MARFEDLGFCPCNSCSILYQNELISSDKKAEFSVLWRMIGPYLVFKKDSSNKCISPIFDDFKVLIFGENRILADLILSEIVKRYDFKKEKPIWVEQVKWCCNRQQLSDIADYIRNSANAEIIATGTCTNECKMPVNYTVILSDGSVEGELVLAYWAIE